MSWQSVGGVTVSAVSDTCLAGLSQLVHTPFLSHECSEFGLQLNMFVFSPREMSSPVQSDDDEVEEVEFVSVSNVYTLIFYLFFYFFNQWVQRITIKKTCLCPDSDWTYCAISI